MIQQFGLTHTASNQVLLQKVEFIPFTWLCHSYKGLLSLCPSERFLGGGEGGGSVRDLMPFGGGARLCLGESVAKMELFLFTAYLMRDFQFTLPKSKASCLPDLRGAASVVLKVKPYKVIVCPRPVNES